MSLVDKYRAVDPDWFSKKHMREAFARGEDPPGMEPEPPAPMPAPALAPPRRPVPAPASTPSGRPQRGGRHPLMVGDERRAGRPPARKGSSPSNAAFLRGDFTAFGSDMMGPEAEFARDTYEDQGHTIVVLPPPGDKGPGSKGWGVVLFGVTESFARFAMQSFENLGAEETGFLEPAQAAQLKRELRR